MHHNHHMHHHNSPRHIIEEVTTFIEPVRRAEEPSRAEIQLDKRSPVLAPRATDSCPPGDKSPRCEKPQGSNALPIALASTIPIVIAIIVLIFLHRRNRKKQALEDMDAKHRSLDFGLEHTSKGKKGKNGATQMGEKPRGHAVGMSMDMNLGSPYLLPAGLNSSRESFHSLSRSIKDRHDPYRPVAHLSNDDPYTRGLRQDNSSIYTGSSKGTDHLLRGASPMGRSIPQRSDSIPTPLSNTTPPEIKFPEPTHQPDSAISGVAPKSGVAASAQEQKPSSTDSYFGSTNDAQIKGSSTLIEPVLAAPGSSSAKYSTSPSSTTAPANGSLPSNPRPPRLQSMEASLHHQHNKSVVSVSSDYGDNFKVTPPSPIVETTLVLPALDATNPSQNSETPPPAGQQQKAVGLGVDGLEVGANKRFSMSIRPLPPDDPTENPEERANRIRSFYREYFDDSKPDPVGHYADYYEDYGQEYLEGAVFDPNSGNFIMAGAPFAEPLTRRAMTPPPRAPPRMMKGHFSSGSTARFMPPRGQSSMSARGAPRKPLPPPSTLKSLPTPHLLKDDNNLFTALDFAPPVSYRDRQAGRRPDSPLGTPRPYSPAVKSHTPLVSPFAELKAMPSPHLLRKSGTFTGLDFAPNAHLLKSPDSNSDAHSVMSGRSGISQMQLHNIRAGAYRISRIPKEVVGTKDDISTALKPKWDLSVPA